MVIHLPPSVSAPAAVYMQETFARNADHEPRCSPELQHPFGARPCHSHSTHSRNHSADWRPPLQTSNFGRLYTTPARQHVDQLCPLKFLHSSTDLTLNPASHPPLTDSSTRPGGATVHFLTWPALVVEQLVLGAHTRDSLHAAAFCVRLALTAGHGLAQAAAARAGARAGAPRDPNAAIVRSLEDALARMVPDATQRAALALAWHVRLDDSARAFPREMEAWERREVGRGVDAQPVGDVEAQYAWVQRVLQTVLRVRAPLALFCTRGMPRGAGRADAPFVSSAQAEVRLLPALSLAPFSPARFAPQNRADHRASDPGPQMRSHAPPQAHSLGRFAPTTREANERARVFA